MRFFILYLIILFSFNLSFAAKKISFRCPLAQDIEYKDNPRPNTWKYIAYAKAITIPHLSKHSYQMQGNTDEKMQVQDAYGASWLEGSFICNYKPTRLNAINLVLWLHLNYNQCHFSFGDPYDCEASEGRICQLICSK